MSTTGIAIVITIFVVSAFWVRLVVAERRDHIKKREAMRDIQRRAQEREEI